MAPGPVCVALSGGMDSMALLAWLQERGDALTAVHVHHGLSPNADAWAAFCEEACAERGIALDVVRVRVPRDAPEGLEAAARRARYAVFAARPEPAVALAHHREDQVETVLLQVLRGTGLRGLAAMPAWGALAGSDVRLHRPFLHVPRADLLAFARARGLRWIEDESNASLAHDRNYLRHAVAPLLDARFPGWRAGAARLAGHAAEAQGLLDLIAVGDGVPAERGQPLRLVAELDLARRHNALRTFLAINRLPMPTQARLEEMASQLYGARADACIALRHAGVVLRRHRGEAFIDAGTGATDEVDRAWQGERDVALGPLGRVRFEPTQGEGLSLRKARQGRWHFAPRRGGERLRPGPGRPLRTLKNLLQEAGVPAWQRDRMPLLFRDDRLVWAPGLGLDPQVACAPGEEGLTPRWTVTVEGSLC